MEVIWTLPTVLRCDETIFLCKDTDFKTIISTVIRDQFS